MEADAAGVAQPLQDGDDVRRVIGAPPRRLRRKEGTVRLGQDPVRTERGRRGTEPAGAWVGDVPGEGNEVASPRRLPRHLLVPGEAVQNDSFGTLFVEDGQRVLPCLSDVD